MVYDPAGRRGLRQDQLLTQVSIGYPNLGMVGTALLPSVPVRAKSDNYYVFGRENNELEPAGDIRAPGTEAHEIGNIEVSQDTYSTEEHMLQAPVTDEEREQVDNQFQPDRDATELVTGKILLGREIAMRDLVTNAAHYATGHTVTLSGTAQWNDYANSDPIGNSRTGFRTIHGKLFMEPNTAIIPYLVMTQLEDHPQLIERIRYSERGVLTPELVATILGIENVIVPGMGYNTANPGQPQNLTYVWGKDVLFAWVPPRAGLKIPAYGYEFTHTYPGGNAQTVDRWREEKRKSDIVRVGRRYDHKLTALDDADKAIAGYVIKNAVA